MRSLVFAMLLVVLISGSVLAFNVPDSYDVGLGDFSFNADVVGTGSLQAVCLTGKYPSKTMFIYQNDQAIATFSFGSGGGKFLVSNFREGLGQDIAFAFNDGSGVYIQSAKIIGYDGSKIAVLLDLNGKISNNGRDGKFVVVDGMLYFDYYEKQYIAGLSSAQMPITLYRIRVYNDGTHYWLGQPYLRN